MDFPLPITAAFFATSFMTAFSYLVSYIKKTQFKEPELLNVLISRSRIFPIEVPEKSFFSWPLHYFIGFLFVIGFDFFWTFTSVEASIFSGAGLGIVAGFIGLAGWKSFFYLSHDPPEIQFKEFYLQLLVAHIIFGATSGAVYTFW